MELRCVFMCVCVCTYMTWKQKDGNQQEGRLARVIESEYIVCLYKNIMMKPIILYTDWNVIKIISNSYYYKAYML